MRFESLDSLGLDATRVALVGAGAGALLGVAVQLVFGAALGTAAVPMDIALGGLAFYMVVTAPKRLCDASLLAQSREAQPLAAMASVAFSATGSRARALLSLEPSERELSRAVEAAKRNVLLGQPVRTAAEGAAGRLRSRTAASALRKAASLTADAVRAGDTEAKGVASALALADESKLPVFVTVCFFTPILLLLLASFSSIWDPWSLAELLALQLVVLDIAFYLCSGERRQLT